MTSTRPGLATSSTRVAAWCVRVSRTTAISLALFSVAVGTLLAQTSGQLVGQQGVPADAAGLLVVAALSAGLLAAHSADRRSYLMRFAFVGMAATGIVARFAAGGGDIASDLGLALLALAVSGLGNRAMVTRISQPAALGAIALAISGLLAHSGLIAGQTGSALLLTSPGAALVLGILGAAVFVARPRWGAMSAVTSTGPVGRISRVVLVAALVVPALAAVVESALGQLSGGSDLVAGAAMTLTIAAVGIGAGAAVTAAATAYRRANQAEGEVSRLMQLGSEQHPLQMALFDDLVPEQANIPGWDVAASHTPAVGVLAGDWWDVIAIGQRRLLVMLDVVGHGARSALIASWAKHTVVGALQDGATPSQALSSAERLFCELDEIATMSIVEISGRQVTYASAGHPPMVHIGNDRCELVGATAPPLGVGTAYFPQRSFDDVGGGGLVCVSDGIIESRNASGDEWGTEQLRKTVSDRRSERATDLVEVVVDAARKHAKADFVDDATVVALKFGRGVPPGQMSAQSPSQQHKETPDV